MISHQPNPPYDYSTIYWYDSRGRLNRLAGPATPGNWVNYLYLADSDLVEKIEYRGPALEEGYSFIASVIRTFEPNRDLITSVENKWDSTTVSKFEYTNDALGRRTLDTPQVLRAQDRLRPASRPGRASVTVSGTAFSAAGTTGFDLFAYTLDTPQGLRFDSRLRRASRPGQADRNELASARRYTGGTLENPTNPVYTRHFEYAYDPTLDMPRTLRVPERLRRAARQGQVGNRESYQIGQGTATSYTANELNQYTATADPSESFTYDDDGNLTQDGTYTYVWDAENRLIEIRPTSPGTNAIKFVYDYDYMGRRARRTQYGWTGSQWSTSIADQRIYLYDRWNNLIIYDADNGMAIGRKLTWGLDLSGLNGGAAPSPVDPNRDREGAVIPGMHGAGGIGGLVAAWAPASPAKQYFCFYDANGNLSDCLKNSDGTRWSHFEYDPYGGQIVATDPGGLSHQFRYSTKFYQAAFGNYDFGYRILEPRHGRWISRDPVGLLGGLNHRAFVYNRPTGLLDPVGLWEQDVHLDLTTKLAELAGICCPEFIGKAANLPDEDYRKAGLSCALKMVALYIGGGARYGPALVLAEARLVQEWHFPLSASGRVDPGSPAARAKINAARLTCDLQAFGEGLHTFQDSWSHQGVPPVWGLIGHSRGAQAKVLQLPDTDPPQTLTYYRRLSGLRAVLSTSADDVSLFPGSLRAMAIDVYKELKKFKEACPCACPKSEPGPPEWRVIPTDGLGPRTAVLVPGPARTVYTNTDCGDAASNKRVADWLEERYPGEDVVK